jgi:hypothetical protein
MVLQKMARNNIDPIRFSILYLIYYFPKFMPITKKWMLNLLWILDNRIYKKTLIPDWTKRWDIMYSQKIVDEFSEIGCLNLFKDKIKKELIEKNSSSVDPELLKALESLVAKMNECNSIIEFYKLRKLA